MIQKSGYGSSDTRAFQKLFLFAIIRMFSSESRFGVLVADTFALWLQYACASDVVCYAAVDRRAFGVAREAWRLVDKAVKISPAFAVCCSREMALLDLSSRSRIQPSHILNEPLASTR